MGQVQNAMLHFSKVCSVCVIFIHFWAHAIHQLELYLTISINREAVALSAELLHHIESSTVFPQDIVEHIGGQSITTVIRGFCTSAFPLWRLGTLLGENHVHEDIMNGLFELLYFRFAASTDSKDPTRLFLPTFFMSNAVNNNGHLTGSTFKALRERINAFPFTLRMISFLACINGHYTAYVYDRTTFQYGDTMGSSQTTTTQAASNAFQSLIEGIDIPQKTSLIQGDVSLQGHLSGSCGIGSLAWIEKQNDSFVTGWTDETSGVFRDRYLCNLLIFDMISRNSPNVSCSFIWLMFYLFSNYSLNALGILHVLLVHV